MKQLQVNGVAAEIAASTIAELLAERGIDPQTRFLAVAVNGCVVRRADWPGVAIAAGDRIEIVRPLQGG